MLASVALILLGGIILGGLAGKLHLPPLLGMLIAGIILGPCLLNLIDGSVLEISPQLRRIALIIILARAGLNLDPKALKKVGRPALLMCFLPACFEIAGTVLLAPPLLGLSVVDSAVLGSVIAAVSPAVVVPAMLKLNEERYGTDKGIPQLIMAGASVDDVFVIVLFSVFTGLSRGNGINAADFIQIPVSIVLGLSAGIICGLGAEICFRYLHVRDSVKAAAMLAVSFLLVSAEDALSGIVGFSGLLAVMGMFAAFAVMRGEAGKRLSAKLSKLWVAAEVMLFVLVGAAVDVKYALAAGAAAIALIFGALLFRVCGVAACLIKTRLNAKERLFCMLAYTPKATVQAALGAVPLAMGLSCGDTVLTAAVLAILITAPLGALAINLTYKRLLTHEGQKSA